MYFYKIKVLNGQEYIIFNSNAEYKDNSLALEYAVKTGILPKKFYSEELIVVCVEEDDYTKFLIEEMNKHFQNKLDIVLDNMTRMFTEDMTHACYEVVYLNNIISLLNSDDSARFDYKILEKWLKNPDEMVLRLLKRVSDADYSAVNDMIYDLIDNEMEE